MVLQLTHPRVLCRYSPDENPIEAGFHQWKMKVKRDFHNVAVKSKVELVRVMEESFASISGEDMAPHFKEAARRGVHERLSWEESREESVAVCNGSHPRLVALVREEREVRLARVFGSLEKLEELSLPHGVPRLQITSTRERGVKPSGNSNP